MEVSKFKVRYLVRFCSFTFEKNIKNRAIAFKRRTILNPKQTVTPRRRSRVDSSQRSMLKSRVCPMFFHVFAFPMRSETIGSVVGRSHARMRFFMPRFQSVRDNGRASEKCFICFCQRRRTNADASTTLSITPYKNKPTN